MSFIVFFYLEVFGNPLATPLFVETDVDRPTDNSQYQNWTAETRRRIAKRRGKKPETKAGQIWALWPDIKAAIAEGQRIATIRDWLKEEAGISLTTASLATYIQRCRRKELAGGKAPSETVPLVPAASSMDSMPAGDPMAGAREALTKPRFDIRKLHGDGDPTGRKLI